MPRNPDRTTLEGLPEFSFNRVSGRYYDNATGRFVSRETIVGVIEDRAQHHAAVIEDITNALYEGNLNVADWQRAMKQQIKLAHLQQGALGAGGWDNLDAINGRQIVGGKLAEQYRYLANFADQIAAGDVSQGQALARARMYGKSSRQSHWRVASRQMERQSGATQERRLAVGDDGTCSTCMDLERKGWQPIGSLPDPGEACEGLTNCRCEKEYRDASGQIIGAE